MKRAALIAVLLLIVAAVAGVCGWLYRDTAHGLPPMPTEFLQVSKVRFIEVPEYVEVPGEQPPPRVVEKVVFKTLPAPPAEIREVAIACNEGAILGTLEGRITTNAVKFVGEIEGKPVEGWDGVSTCEMRPGPDREWVTFVQEPFAFAQSRAESILPPVVPRRLPRMVETRIGGGFPAHASVGASWYDTDKRWGWGADFSVLLEPEEIYSRNFDGFRQVNRYRGTVYLTRRWGKR